MVAKVDGLSEDGFEAGGMMVDMQVECAVVCRISRSPRASKCCSCVGFVFQKSIDQEC